MNLRCGSQRKIWLELDLNSHHEDTGATLYLSSYRVLKLEASFIQFKCTRYSRDNLTLSMRIDVQCFNSISLSSSGYYETKTSQLTYTAEGNWKMLTGAEFELAPSGYRSAPLHVELSCP